LSVCDRRPKIRNFNPVAKSWFAAILNVSFWNLSHRCTKKRTVKIGKNLRVHFIGFQDGTIFQNGRQIRFLTISRELFNIFAICFQLLVDIRLRHNFVGQKFLSDPINLKSKMAAKIQVTYFCIFNFFNDLPLASSSYFNWLHKISTEYIAN
jgi:hypothetical protein